MTKKFKKELKKFSLSGWIQSYSLRYKSVIVFYCQNKIKKTANVSISELEVPYFC